MKVSRVCTFVLICPIFILNLFVRSVNKWLTLDAIDHFKGNTSHADGRHNERANSADTGRYRRMTYRLYDL